MELGSFVGLADYPAGSPIYGAMSSQEYSDLAKALETGSGVLAAGDSTGLAPLRVQSLENTLKVVTAGQRNLKLWPRLAKRKAFSTAEEYSRMDALGGIYGTDGFLAEVATPVETAEAYSRQVAQVKFMGVKKNVSLAATLVNNIVSNIEAHEAMVGTTELLIRLENALVWGNTNLNSLQFPGFVQQLVDYRNTIGTSMADIIYDMEGRAPDEDMMESAGAIVAGHYGALDYMLMGFQAKSDLQKSLFGYQRTVMPPANGDGRWGTPFKQYEGSQGLVDLDSSVFIKPVLPPTQAAEAISGAPTRPLSDTLVATSGAADSSGKLENNKRYTYWVTAGAQGQESLIGTNAAGNALASAYYDVPNDGAAYKCTVTIPAGQNASIKYFNIYRATTAYGVTAPVTVAGITGVPTTASLVARVKRGYSMDINGAITVLGGGDADKTIYVDFNQNRENTSIALGFTWDPDQVVQFKQLAPLMKLPLAVVETAVPFMILLFGVPVMFAPSKCILLKNIGRLT